MIRWKWECHLLGVAHISMQCHAHRKATCNLSGKQNKIEGNDIETLNSFILGTENIWASLTKDVCDCCEQMFGVLKTRFYRACSDDLQVRSIKDSKSCYQDIGLRASCTGAGDCVSYLPRLLVLAQSWLLHTESVTLWHSSRVERI